MSVSDSSCDPDLPRPALASSSGDVERELDELSRVLSPFSPWVFALFSLITVLFGRGIAPALPGSRAGIDIWITRFETGSTEAPSLAAWLTQLTLISGIWLCSLLLQRALSESGGAALFRLLAVVATPALLALVGFLNITQGELGGPWLLAVAVVSAILGGASAFWAMRCLVTRAAGLILMLITLAGSINVGARVLALSASEQARAFDFTIARVLATVGFSLEVAATLVALWWFLIKPSRGRIVVALALLMSALFLAFEAAQGALGSEFWQVLLTRTLNELSTQPDPLVVLSVRNFFELLSWGVGLCVLLKPKSPPLIRAVISLALASRGNIDTPLCALLLVSSALLAALPAIMLRNPRRGNVANRAAQSS